MSTKAHWTLRLLALAAIVVAFACTKTYLHAEPVQDEGVAVQPMQVWISGHKLWVRVNVVNQGSEPIMVERDAIVARLPNGVTVGRAMGRTSLHGAYFIPPYASHAVFVEFEEQGFDWDTVPRVTIDFTQGVHRGATPVPLQMAIGL